MELHATSDSSFEDEVPASILPPREPTPPSAPVESQEPAAPAPNEGLAVRDEAPRIASDPPQVLDLEELAFHEESQRIASDPPQYLDVAELALHEESQRIDSDPPQFLDVAALELAERAPGCEVGESIPAGPQLQPTPEPPALATPGVGPLPAERGALKLKITPRVSEGSTPPPVASRALRTTPEPAQGQAIGTPLRPRKLLAPRQAEALSEIDAELIPEEVHEEFAARRESQDQSVAERQARAQAATKRSALVIGGVFALGGLLLSVGSGLGAFLLFLVDIGVGAGTGWYLGRKRPNRLVGAVMTWAAGLGLICAHLALVLGLYGPGSAPALFLPLLLFQALAALSGMFLSTYLESLESDQSI